MTIQLPAGAETPYYYYNLDLLERTLHALTEAASGHPDYHVHYAVKANANRPILEFIAKAGLGADCVSGGEVAAAAEAGFNPDQIVFAGVGKTDREIVSALKLGIHSFNVESVAELRVISELAQREGYTARVAFRINPNVDAHTHAKITTGREENKFGIALEDLYTALRLAEELPGIDFIGLHFHIGSQILDLSVYERLCKKINQIQDELNRRGVFPASINVGGGLGVDYKSPLDNPIPDFKSYFDIFARHLTLRPSQQLHFELGRSIVAQCGILVARTLYIKEGHSRRFLIVDAGFTDLLRPAMYNAHHFTLNLSRTDEEERELYDVVGPICESSDVFSTDELLPRTRRGDLIAFLSAGAYGEVMASTYNLRRLPAAYYGEWENNPTESLKS